MTEVVVSTHETRWCGRCELRWAVGRVTMAGDPATYRCDGCEGPTVLATFNVITCLDGSRRGVGPGPMGWMLR